MFSRLEINRTHRTQEKVLSYPLFGVTTCNVVTAVEFCDGITKKVLCVSFAP